MVDQRPVTSAEPPSFVAGGRQDGHGPSRGCSDLPVARPAATADLIDRAEAAHVLAVHVATVDRLIRRGVLVPARRFATAQLSRSEVERLALTNRPVAALVAGGYWVTRRSAAALLQRSERRVQQLADTGRLPYETHTPSGWRMYRRAQIEVIGRARRLRFGASARH